MARKQSASKKQGGAKARKRTRKQAGAKAGKRSGRKRWARKVKTESTFPPEGLFNQDAQTIARSMASKKVSPKGIGSGIRMVQLYINRAGKNLSATRRRELEKAKRILQEKKRAQEQEG